MISTEKTDQEVICSFMEPGADARTDSDFQWWGQVWSNGVRTVHPRTLDLDALREVQERLTDEQRKLYTADLTGYGDNCAWRLVHATAEQKIRALASVLRKEKS